MIFSENRCPLFGIMLEFIVGPNLGLEIVAIHPNSDRNFRDQQAVNAAQKVHFGSGHGRGSMK
jgi:hypothetical protein